MCGDLDSQQKQEQWEESEFRNHEFKNHVQGDQLVNHVAHVCWNSSQGCGRGLCALKMQVLGDFGRREGKGTGMRLETAPLL